MGHGRDAAPERERTPGAEMQPRRGRLSTRSILTTRVGLLFPSSLDFDDWARAGAKIAGLIDSFGWCMGDWLVYGQDKFDDRYSEVTAAVGLDYQTLRNYAWVARKVDLSRRRESLSFQHHAEVARLSPDEQNRWLDLAVENRWSRNELRRHLRSAADRAETPDPSVVLLPRVEVAKSTIDAWSRAATHAREDLTHWMVRVLDRASADTLVGTKEVKGSPRRRSGTRGALPS